MKGNITESMLKTWLKQSASTQRKVMVSKAGWGMVIKIWMRYSDWKLDEVQRSKAGWGTVIDWKAGWGAVTSKPDSQRQQHQAQSEPPIVPSVPTPGPLSPVTPCTTTIQVNLNIYMQHFFLQAVFYTRTLQRTTFLNLSTTEVFTSIVIFFARKSLQRRFTLR